MSGLTTLDNLTRGFARFGKRSVAPLQLVAVVWGSSLLLLSGTVDWPWPGVIPGERDGLWGLLFMPFVHASWVHLVSNTSGLLILGLLLGAGGRAYFWGVSLAISVLTGLGVWLFGAPGLHIGASGLVFGYFGFLIVRGFFDQSLTSLSIAFAVALVYGGLIWGVLPAEGPVSWEAHLSGLVAGALVARVLHGFAWDWLTRVRAS